MRYDERTDFSFRHSRNTPNEQKTETVILEICNANFLSHLICIYFKSRGTMRLGLFWFGFMDAHNGVCLQIAFVCSAKFNLKFHATIESTTSALLCCRKTLSLFTTIDGNRFDSIFKRKQILNSAPTFKQKWIFITRLFIFSRDT